MLHLKKRIYYTDEIAKPIRESTQGKSGSWLTVDYRNEPIIASWSPINVANKNWGIVTKIDQQEAFFVVKDLKKSFLITMFSALFSSIFILFINIKIFTRPVYKLKFLVEKISTGDFTHKISDFSNDEIGELAESFNDMTDKLNKITISRDELALEIEQRKRVQKEFEDANSMLELFNKIAVGRETRMVELKKIINELSNRLGEKPPYDLSFAEGKDNEEKI